jgi:DNA-binding CsgD family transcriptional regulator
VNRWTRLDAAVGLLRAATGDRPERSLVWREMLADYDVDDVASVVFRDEFGTWAFLDLWRVGRGVAFTSRDAEFLKAVADPVTGALRRSQALTFELSGPTPDRTGPVVLALSPGLEVRTQTPETDLYLRQLVPPDAGRPPIPAGAYNVAAQLLAVERGIDTHPPVARVHLTRGTWLTLRAARMGGAARSAEQDIAVSIEPASPAERISLYVQAFGLSAREAELVSHLATGADTREVADRMFLSANTVQDHLKSIFAKTGAGNRRTLLARAVGR